MQHFVRVMQGYFSNQIIEVTWQEFMSDLETKVHTLNCLHDVHAQYLNTSHLRSEANKLWCFMSWWWDNSIMHFYTPVERQDVLWNGPVRQAVRPSTIAWESDILKTPCRIDFTFWYGLNTTKTSHFDIALLPSSECDPM